LSKGSDYTAAEENFPDGEDVEIFTFKALEKAWRKAGLSSQREHVTPFIKNNPALFKLKTLACVKDFSGKRWTLDERKDYEFIKLVYKNLYHKNNFFGIEQIIKFLQKHPEYENINAGIKRNEGYVKSLKNDKVVKLV
jgi:spore coat polysaccharide biosynthesis protein SpsF (cytidylyltransferase family)